MYKVVRDFADKEDNNRNYRAGDVYPREGYTPSLERLEYLSSAKTPINAPVIALTGEKPEKVEIPAEEVKPRKTENKGGKRRTRK